MGGRAKISTATLTAGRITYARQWQRQCCVLNILICHPLKAMSVRRPVMLNYAMSGICPSVTGLDVVKAYCSSC